MDLPGIAFPCSIFIPTLGHLYKSFWIKSQNPRPEFCFHQNRHRSLAMDTFIYPMHNDCIHIDWLAILPTRNFDMDCPPGTYLLLRNVWQFLCGLAEIGPIAYNVIASMVLKRLCIYLCDELWIDHGGRVKQGWVLAEGMPRMVTLLLTLSGRVQR